MTTTFQLDTTGYVDVAALGIFKLPGHIHAQTTVQWSDLSPFTQGYIEALFATFSADFQKEWGASNLQVRFSDLAPETLARIIADCEAIEAFYPQGVRFSFRDRPDFARETARMFWGHRQSGHTRLPPLTVTLGDDGKVRFA